MQINSLINNIKETYQSTEIFSTIEDLADCPKDPESAEECSVFINKGWQDITLNDWSFHHYAISFFTLKARRLFFPSVMLYTINNPTESYLAFTSYMYHIRECHSRSDLNLIIGNSDAKFACFSNWVFYINGNLPVDFKISLAD
ncbi:MAG: hypothetical protein JHD23_04395 [Akkermansiaceae bacterium]|jgi:hypothetical protein|nr:hypothetical protein [Akkermansiaceae bacterium]MBJ7396734.1 hypothetical protein [Akkermansiaceae bacterium]MBJ7423707.1 hypothetical protein [Akkermansiaceae bacterium]